MIRNRTRIALVAAAGLNVAVVASATSRIFDSPYSPAYAVIGALLATVVAIVNPARQIALRTAAQAIVCLVATTLAVRSRTAICPPTCSARSSAASAG